jgi:lipopolysaccharide cholinephosphotransferase
MKRLSKQEQREIQLNILANFVNFCETHKLRYFLDGGSLLGAIRHNGYIPWDDDIDVGMPRSDYEKLREIAKQGINEYLFIEEPKDSIYPMIKIVDCRTILIEFPKTIKNKTSVYIDIFPKDGLPKSLFLSKILCKTVKFYVLWNWFNKVSIYKWRKNQNIIKKIASLIGQKIVNERNKNFPLNHLQKKAQKYSFDESIYCSTIIAGGMANRVKTNLLNTYEKHQFENLLINIPIGWDEYLTKLYGQYMNIPNKEKQVMHDNEAYIVK